MGRGWNRTAGPDRRAGYEPVPDPLRSPDTRARVVAGLFFVIPLVCLAGLWLGVQPSGRPELDRWTVALNLGCLALAPAVWRHGARWPVLVYEWLAASTIVALLGLMAAYGDSSGSYLITTLVELLLVVCFAFLPTRAAAVQLVVAAVGLGVAVGATAPTAGAAAGRWLVVMCAFVGSAVVVGTLRHRLGAVIDRLNRLARTDPLTGVANRRAVVEHLERVLAGAGAARPVAVVVGDLDHFKLVNDTFGHARGDELLTAVAAALVEAVGPSDLVGRLGGEEFALVFDGLDEDAALALVGRLAVDLRALPGLPGEVTMSFGVCVARAPGAPAGVLDRADQALYEAKRSGRDRAVLAR